MSDPTFFNAHHSPIGAFASFTFGSKGPHGGLGLELAGPANERLFIGIEDSDIPSHYHALPFFNTNTAQSGVDSYDADHVGNLSRNEAVQAFTDSDISRTLGASFDTWIAGDLTFRVISPVREIPDPEVANDELLKETLVPSVIAELTLDNRNGTFARKAFFGYAGSERANAMRIWREDGYIGLGQGNITSIACHEEHVYAGIGFQPESILDPVRPESLTTMIGDIGLLVATVPAGTCRTITFSISFFREASATTGMKTRYLYRRWFDRVEDVATFALGQADEMISQGALFDAHLQSDLSPHRALMLAHAIRSYYGATQLLETETGAPVWVVNEGEYRMMNTLDLTVDQVFFELAMNPWTVRNVLDMFESRYSYWDPVSESGTHNTYPGGIAFTHDMGVGNTFSAAGQSSYEQAGLTGCFSYMSNEEIHNWALTACLYVSHTKNIQWLELHKHTFEAIVRSLGNRDHPVDSLRNGVMGHDAARCKGGSEITTYDSLDASLGQARNSLYLAVKSWALYTCIEPLLRQADLPCVADEAANQAARCATTLCRSVTADGTFPAVISEGVEAKIIPVIEALIYPWILGLGDTLAPSGPYGDLRRSIESHFHTVLDNGTCRFADGGWRLSSTSQNSWLSKIYLCQSVAEKVFGDEPDETADTAHLGWLMDTDNAYYAWSDQMRSGKVVGSRYYPRGVTGILWLAKSGIHPIQQIRDALLSRPVGAL